MPASMIVMVTSWIDAETKRVGSNGIRKSTPGGNDFFNSAILSRIACATSSALAPDCRNVAMPIEGLPDSMLYVS